MPLKVYRLLSFLQMLMALNGTVFTSGRGVSFDMIGNTALLAVKALSAFMPWTPTLVDTQSRVHFLTPFVRSWLRLMQNGSIILAKYINKLPGKQLSR